LLKRVDKLTQDVIKYCINFNIGTLIVLNLGDMLSGAIHATTRLAEEMDTLEQAMLASELIYQLLFNLQDFGINIKYASVVGNHDRSNKSFKEHIEKESFNKIIDWYILNNIGRDGSNIEFIGEQVDEGIIMFNFNKPCFAVHGHRDKVDRVCSKLGMALNVVPHAVFMGHWHRHGIVPEGFSKTYINGSLCGVDTFAKDNRLFGHPSQTLVVVDGNNTIDVEIVLNI
jgi:hypothetical protein